MTTPEPQAEHQWLTRLVGEWTYQSSCNMTPGEPPMTYSGTDSVRSLGGLWILCEGRGDPTGDMAMSSLMTIGYDPAKKRFVGTFIASMMTHLWPYDGSLDAAGRVLTLDSEGPSMADDGTMAKYQDVFEMQDDDHRTLTARVLTADGTWNEFMKTHYTRTA